MPRFSIMPLPGETINIKKSIPVSHPTLDKQKSLKKSLLEHTGFGKKKKLDLTGKKLVCALEIRIRVVGEKTITR